LNHLVKPFILRRTKKELLTELPDKIYEDIYIPLYDEEKKLYKAAIENIDLFSNGNNKIKILALLTRLKQICCHPKLIDENYKNHSSKLELFNDVVQNAISSGHRILVFSQFTSMLNILADSLKKSKIDYFMLTGSTANKDRLNMANNFNDGEKEVFLISLKAGGTGLNLTGADVVIHFDQWWNPAVEEQATDRAYRIGQDKNVQVIRLISKGTIEEKIQLLHQNKRELIEQIISSNEKSILSLTPDELKDLIKLDELV
jgi:SNF2 family DNA or RNA helicase